MYDRQCNILIGVDSGFIQHACVMLCSLFANNPGINFYVYVASGNREKLEILEDFIIKSRQIFEYIQIDESLLRNAKVTDHVTSSCYYRIIAPELISSDVRQLIYLDCDLIIKGSIEELLQIDYSKFSLGAVPDYAVDSDKNARLGISSHVRYFNSGVMIINLEKWRELNATTKLLDFILNEPEKIEFWDQDALNWFFSASYLELPEKYNYQTKNSGLEPYPAPVIVHYTGPSKPWMYTNRHPFKADYYKYLRSTPFKHFIPAEKSIGNFLRKYKLMPKFAERILSYKIR